jgi:vesicle-fusing ATPase
VFRQVLEDMEMLSAFTAILHVPNLSQRDHLMAVLEESDVFSRKDLSSMSHKVQGHRYVILKRAQMQH